MKRDYKFNVIDLPNFPPLMEIIDPPYFQEDLYELIGSKGFVATFIFREGTETLNRYGYSITGQIFYAKGVKEKIEASIKDGKDYADEYLKVKVILPRLDQAEIDDIKYKGFPIEHIQSINFVPYKREPEIKSNLKVVPNVIKIPVSKTNFNVDEEVFYQNIILRKLSSETELIQEEKAQFIGSILAMNQNQIDQELLISLGYTIEKASDDRRIWYHYYKTKKKRNILSKEEVNNCKNVEFEDLLEKINLLIKELVKGHKPGEAISISNEQIIAIIQSLKNFHPRVLIPTKRQIWWDTKSYLHIVLRHVKDFQIGKLNECKTPFPYAFEELELLIRKVIESVIGEIEAHFEIQKIPSNFYRVGKMSIPYNEDFYSLHIREDGLLENFHIVEED